MEAESAMCEEAVSPSPKPQARERSQGQAFCVAPQPKEDFCSFPIVEQTEPVPSYDETDYRSREEEPGAVLVQPLHVEEQLDESEASSQAENIHHESPAIRTEETTADESEEAPQREHPTAPSAIYRMAPPPKPPRAFVDPDNGATAVRDADITEKYPTGARIEPNTPASTGFEGVCLIDDQIPEQDITDMSEAPSFEAAKDEGVVRLDLSDLAPEETDTILEVLGKDSIFRAEEKGRIDKIEAEVHEESQRQRSAEQRSKDARRACLRCGRPFRIFFNKRLVCRLCAGSICRRCATFEEGRGGWVCFVCMRERELQANRWLSEIQLRHRVTFRTAAERRFSDSEDDSGYDPSVSQDGSTRHKPTEVTGLDAGRVTSEVRGHLENVVETLVGESIQGANIRPSPADAWLYKEFHIKLATAISRLTQSLCMTLQNRPVEEPLTPTTTLAELKAVLQEAQQAAMRLPLRTEDDGPQATICEESRETNSLTSANSAEGYPEEPNSQTYEEILATAVLSQLAEKARRAPTTPPHNGTAYCDAAVQSDDVTTTASDDVTRAEIDETEGSEPERASPGSGMLEITIEEEIEEVLEYESAVEGSDVEEDARRRASIVSQTSTLGTSSGGDGDQDDSVVLPGPSISYSDLDFEGGKSVPFPELGTSLPDSSSMGDSGEEPDGTSWEENWLFRRRRLTQNNRLLGEEPVPMLVPDPSDPTQAIPTVGSRDVDELSDLSERGLEDSLDEWRPVSPVGDVTERLRAASNADRDRYLTGKLDTADSRFLGEAANSERLVAAHLVGSNSSDTLISGSSLPSDPESRVEVTPTTAESGDTGDASQFLDPELTPTGPISEAEMIYRKHCALKAAVKSQSLDSTPRKSPKVERRIAQLEQKSQSLTRTPPGTKLPAANPASTPSITSASPAQNTVSPSSSNVPLNAVKVSPLGTSPASKSVPSNALKNVSSPGTNVPVAKNASSHGTNVPPGACTELVTQAGLTVQFRCRLPAEEGAEIHWLRGGEVLEPSQRIEMFRQRQHAYLVLYEAGRRDRGHYSCLMVIAGQETWHHFNLRVISSGRTPQRPSLPLVPDSDQQPVSGGTMRLLVRTAGYPEPRVTFLRGDRPVRRSPTTSIERHSGGEWVLSIHPVAADDAGPYRVQATSSQGTAHAQFSVAVAPPTEPPPAPDSPPMSPEPVRPVRPPVRPSSTTSGASLISQARLRPVTLRSAPLTLHPATMTSPPEFVTSREEALKETSLTEACNTVILRATPARVRAPAEGGRDSDQDSDDEAICLPELKSGSIAEREYRKWQNAVEMPNNPYTRERVRQRRTKMLDRTGYYSQNLASSGDDASDQDLARNDSSNKIYCGLKSIDSSMYRRDYYVNAGGDARSSSLPVRRKMTSSRPVSVMSEEPLPPLSEHASTDDLPSAAAAGSNGSVYHSAESLATAPTVAADEDAPSPALQENGHEERGESAGSGELPPEGTVRSAIEKMNTLSQSSEHLAQGVSPMNGRRSSGRQSTSPAAVIAPDAVNGTNGSAITPPPTPPAGHVEADASHVKNGTDHSTPLYVEVGEREELEQRPSPDGRESLGSNGSGDIPPQLPSVKQLRSHFQTNSPSPTVSPTKPLSPLMHTNVLIIDKSDPEAWDEPRELRKVEKLRKKISNHKVHSLTARSVSREFREGLKLGAPLSLQSSGNIRDINLMGQQRNSLPPVIDERNEGLETEEILEEDLPAAKLVTTRAAFWDKKVAEETV